MPRPLSVRLLTCLITLALVTPLLAGSVSADSDVIVSGGFTTTDAGAFSVGIAAMPTSGDCTNAITGDVGLGSFEVDARGDANGVVPSALSLCLSYNDSEVSRDPFTVQLAIDSFELKNPPTFEGAENVHFQIPNRYLVLKTVGEITSTGTRPSGNGTFESVPGQDQTFDLGAVTIARAGGPNGTGTSVQRVDLTLNIPAGVYPGEYDSVITIEMIASS